MQCPRRNRLRPIWIRSLEAPRRSARDALGVRLAALMLVVAVGGGGAAACQDPPRPNQEGAPNAFGLDPEDDTPLVDRLPFDRITLNNVGENAVLYVRPLELTGPVNTQRDGFLKFEILDRPSQIFLVPWRAIAKIERFDEMIVEETRSSFRAGQLDTAFRNLLYLFDKGGANDPVVKELLHAFWFADADKLMNDDRSELARSILEELYRANPTYAPGGRTAEVPQRIASLYDRTLKQWAELGDFEQVRRRLEEIRQTYAQPPPPLAKLLADWGAELQRQIEAKVQQATQAARSDDPYVANVAVRQLQFSVPEEPQTRTSFADVLQRLPAVLVGVSQESSLADLRAVDHWGKRRLGGLLQRQLVYLAGLGDDGGLYQFGDGRLVSADEYGRAYRFELTESHRRFTTTMSAYQLASRLARLIDESSPEFSFPLAKLVQSIEILGEGQVRVHLGRPHARLESLLRVPWSGDESLGPYADAGAAGEGTRMFEPSPMLLDSSGQARPRVIERKFENGSLAADALLRGEVDVLDRVFPADLRRLREDPAIAVQPYAIPSIHLLVPNPRNPYMQDQSFRRGLLYAIDRDRLIRQVICGGQTLPGFVTLSGPFPTGTEENDLIGYGYDGRIAPTPYSVFMAIVSPAVVSGRLRKAAEEKLKTERAAELENLDDDQVFKKIQDWLDADKSLAVPKLVLAYPASDVATVTCPMIQAMLGEARIEVELRPLPPGVTRPEDDNYDLLYVDLTIEEPLSDTRKILGDLGLVPKINASIEQLLSELDLAKNWVEARAILRQIHEQCQYDLVVLPLWQTINYYAYRKHVQGLGTHVIHLYEGVDQWRLTLPAQD